MYWRVRVCTCAPACLRLFDDTTAHAMTVFAAIALFGGGPVPERMGVLYDAAVEDQPLLSIVRPRRVCSLSMALAVTTHTLTMAEFVGAPSLCCDSRCSQGRTDTYEAIARRSFEACT